ncbi:energy-coupling factor transporter transmembrane component T family protein [Peteryoungia ipomoeae]|uniref:Energy-coupling factor transporter transmembrane protein EcfT n=1 Tax=Peteryoungia ipomoeae TaxID=1210932 RepID=A0A4V4HMS1_9HYPH|nr:energy-coupling factor transporter transmembrane protein EcfT [Peteryoungia ipomoeae]THV23156.1 energy-coupling factor transporter transmembrane protein EcfT [Peteryoungia ipomoeae]
MLTSLHVAGNSLLHRIPVKLKLLALLVWGLALYLVENPIVLFFGMVMTGLLYLSTGIGASNAYHRLKPVLFTIAFLGLVNILFLSPGEALEITLRLLAILFLAAAVTASTEIGAFIATITALARPLERLGLLKAADIGLAFGLVLRFVPEIAARYEALKEAHAARGITVRLSRMLGPLIIATLRDADRIAEAIDARGIRGQ